MQKDITKIPEIHFVFIRSIISLQLGRYRGLLPVIRNYCRSKPHPHEVFCVGADRIHALFLKIGSLRIPQMEAASELDLSASLKWKRLLNSDLESLSNRSVFSQSS